MAFLVISVCIPLLSPRVKNSRGCLLAGSVCLVPMIVIANKSIQSSMLMILNITDGSSLECPWGSYPHNKFPEESTPRSGGADRIGVTVDAVWCMGQ